MEIALYYAPITCALAPYITLTEAGAKFEVRPLNFRKGQHKLPEYLKINYGVDAEVKAVAARGDHVVGFAKKHRIRTTYRDFHALLADKEIDVVDICTPPMLHATMIVEALQAGKHVICEKPFASAKVYSVGTGLVGECGIFMFCSVPTMPWGMKIMHRMRRIP
jgi:Oxidoreductase family, NAD-binding Rossmann fold/Glutathione S-transferase, N-terminal domain